VSFWVIGTLNKVSITIPASLPAFNWHSEYSVFYVGNWKETCYWNREMNIERPGRRGIDGKTQEIIVIVTRFLQRTVTLSLTISLMCPFCTLLRVWVISVAFMRWKMIARDILTLNSIRTKNNLNRNKNLQDHWSHNFATLSLILFYDSYYLLVNLL